ncbi:MAG: Cof-type HAD-IIB family hydrolase [Bacteroidales bacterium]|nr:Cof-type HAD-IIB family hydrolase [Bacteroidales bacterium]
MTKAIFFDIDGTLLSYKTHRLMPGTIEALTKLHKAGVLLFVASGRPMVLIPDMPIPFDGYITVNGGYCISGDEVLLRCPIAAEDTERWLDYVDAQHMSTMCFTAHDMYVNHITPEAEALRNQLDFTMPPLLPLKAMHGKEVYQFIALMPSEQDADVLSLLPNCRLPRWHAAFTDVIPANSSKAAGIECMLNHFDLKPEETMAFGDGANDVEMLQYVGCGVAMGNASSEVKKQADFVTLTADEEGILHALTQLHLI